MNDVALGQQLTVVDEDGEFDRGAEVAGYGRRAGCQLAGARYGAAGVIGHDGELEQFIPVGIDAGAATRIGDLPQGKGRLGALIHDPKPIRLTQMTDDDRSTLVGAELADDVAACVREALTNVAKHAQATTALVELNVTARALALSVLDDGLGIRPGEHASGVANLTTRAARHGGSGEITPGPAGGPLVNWKAVIT